MELNNPNHEEIKAQLAEAVPFESQDQIEIFQIPSPVESTVNVWTHESYEAWKKQYKDYGPADKIAGMAIHSSLRNNR